MKSVLDPILSILLVEDDEDDYVLTRQLLDEASPGRYRLEWVSDFDQALDRASTNRFDACLLDYRLGGRTGLEWLRTALERGCTIPVILLTGHADLKVDMAAMKAGAADYLLKEQLTAELLERSIRYAVQQRRQEEQRVRLLAERAARERAEAVQETLRRNEEQLRLTLERLNLAMDAAELTSWDWDVRADRVIWSPTDRILGCSAGQATGTYAGWMACVHPDDRAVVESRISKAMAGPGRDCQCEHRVLSADGRVRWVTARGRFYDDDQGQPLRMLGIISDITDRKRIEETLAERTRELARSNAELEQFASVIAHDLRSPLNALRLTVDALQELDGTTEDPSAREFLDLISGSVNSMAALITRVLEYSRAGAQPPVLEACDLESLLDEVLRRLQPVVQETGASVTRGPLPTVPADRAQIGQLFQNLIENALKYCGDAAPRVHVSAEPADGLWMLSVRDNGIGISASELEKVFEFGHRLHDQEGRYSGSGVGLAVCKRIVQRHGGRIWVESTPGKGSTFFLTLPRKVPAARPRPPVAAGVRP